jgi:hypothetical protein
MATNRFSYFTVDPLFDTLHSTWHIITEGAYLFGDKLKTGQPGNLSSYEYRNFLDICCVAPQLRVMPAKSCSLYSTARDAHHMDIEK